MNKAQFLKTFDKSIFQKSLSLLAIRIPGSQCQIVREKVIPYLFDKPRLRSILTDPKDDSKRLLLLNENITDKSLSQIPKSVSNWILSQKDLSIVPYVIHLDYNYYTASEVLKELLPKDIEIPTSFEQVGHLIHMNLPEHLYPYKYLFGQVLLDKVPSCKTVVNKIGKIDSEFRTFQMEILAGIDNTNVTVKEGKCVFQFDYRKVYWNSRLHREHARLVESFHPQDVIADMFCGVGPFVLPAAKKGCVCYANDLNPYCYSYLKQNMQNNQISPSRIQLYNEDARAFIRELVIQQIPVSHVIMNLPESSETFCDVFKHYSFSSSPIIHCYMFSNKEDPIEDCIQRIERVLQHPLPRLQTEGRIVRDVAPYKRMTCISFTYFSVFSTNNCYTLFLPKISK